jgi:hypothetical protein
MAGSVTTRNTSTKRVNKRLLEPFLVSLSRSVPKGRICFAFELVNEGCCLTQPFEPLLRSEPVKLSVAVEVLGRALSQRALEFCGRLDFSRSIFHFGPAISAVL